MTARSTTDSIIQAVRSRMTAEGTNPRDPQAVTAVARREVELYEHVASLGVPNGGAPPPFLQDPEATIAEVVAAVSGYGALEELLVPGRGVENIYIEGARVTYDQNNRRRVLRVPTTEAENRHVVNRLLAETDVALDRARPILHGAQVLLDENGAPRGRLAASVPPVSPHLSAVLRLFTKRHATLRSLVEWGMISPPCAALITLVLWAKGSILITGEMSSGKTTLLSACLAACRSNHTIRLVEDPMEVQFQPLHGGRCQVVPPGQDGTGERDLRELIQFMLRLTADVIAVGEVRGPESYELTRASRVGAGFLATLHAHSAEKGLENLVLTALGAGPNISELLVRRNFAESLHLVIHCDRRDTHLADEDDVFRQVTEVRVMAPQLEQGRFNTEVLFERPENDQGTLAWTGRGLPTDLARRLTRLLPAGVDLTDVLAGRGGVE